MKMKRRLFQSKNKKKKVPAADSFINDTVNATDDIVPSPDENHAKVSGTKKKLKFRKHKSKNQKPLAGHDSTQQTASAANGANVVLRRGNKPNSHFYTDYSKGNKVVLEKRVPGSVSSSRTPSSASSSSSNRWSSRRPWSLVDPSQAHSVTEYEEPGDEFGDVVPDRPVSSVVLVRRQASNDEQVASKDQNRGFSLDLQFLRRFKRSSFNPKPVPVEKTPSPQSLQPLSPERLSLRLRNFKSSKNSKKNRRSWHEPSTSCTTNAEPEFFVGPPPSTSGHAAARRSVTDPSGFLGIKESIKEEGQHRNIERTTSAAPSSCSYSSSILSPTESASKRLSLHEKLTKQDSNRSSLVSSSFNSHKELCEKCSKEKSYRRSACYCTYVSHSESENAGFQRTVSLITDSQDDLVDSDFPTSPSHYNGCTDTLVVHESPVSRWKLITKSLSSSLANLSKSTSELAFDDEKTLTRQNVRARNVGFRLEAFRGSSIYASSPQLCEQSLSTKNKWKKDLKAAELASNSISVSSVLSRENAVVDSPIKRAIAFPGVVLRRHKRMQHANESHLTKPSSREDRAKQAISLNMEELPTYNEKRNIIGETDGASSETRDLARAAIKYQRYLSHATSVDDLVSGLKLEEFLDLLESGDVQSSREGDGSGQNQEPSTKRVKTLRKSVVSFANLISPGKPGKGKLQRSSSFKESIAPPPPPLKPYRPPGSTNSEKKDGSSSGSNYTPGKRSSGFSTKKRQSKLWCETFNHSGLDEHELKRQEAIFELYQGECVMVQDLKMAKQTYRDSMMTLKMLSDEEVTRIFGTLDCLLPLHEDLLSRLEATRCENGRTEGVGHVFIDWFPTLSPYNEYCANQPDAKETLDSVVNRPRVHDFLQRCLESPFSRKLDLWSYLDLPRSRLVKYPLLLKAIQKATPQEHSDAALLGEALSKINQIIATVDCLTGERQCQFVQSKLEYLDEKKKCPEVDLSRKIVCSGQLKTSRGTKVQVFLFDLALVVTRNATRSDKLMYQVYRQPLPLKYISIETDEGGKLSGSFKGGILSSDKTIKHAFRVKAEQLNLAYTFAASDVHDKKQWINSIQEAMSLCQATMPQGVPLHSSPDHVKLKKKRDVKRSSSSKSDSSTDSQENFRSGRRSSEDRRLIKSPLKIRKNSSSRRNSEQNTSEVVKTSYVPDVPTPNQKPSSEKEKEFHRSQSLTGSPNQTTSNRRRCSGTAIPAAAENGLSKPPLGANIVSPHRYTLRSFSKTPPRSPKLQTTRSTPDLYSYLRRRSIESDRLLSIHDQMTVAATLSHDSPLLSRQLSSIPHQMVDSPDHPAASNTSRNFPIVEEEFVSPAFKSLSSIHMSPSAPSVSVSFSSIQPKVVWDAPARRTSKDLSDCSSRSSSESLTDAPPVLDDPEMILENADSDLDKDADVTFSLGATTSDDVVTNVTMTVNELLDNVCELFEQEKVRITCNDTYITITTDDGTPWHGDDIEMSV